MTRRLATVLLLVLGGMVGMADPVSSASPTSPPAPPSTLPPGPIAEAVVYPYEGHQGDPIYVSGKGFRPGTRVFFTLACPDTYGSALGDGNYIAEEGPYTSKDGSFVAYRFRQKLILHGSAATNGSSCLLYTSYQDVPAADFAYPYTVVRPDIHLPHCVKTICAHVTVKPVRRRDGRTYERVTVQTYGPPIGRSRKPSTLNWIGAHVTISASYPHGVKVPAATLDWNGRMVLDIPLPADMPAHVQTVIHAQFRLGSTTGGQVSSFLVKRP